MSIARRPGGGRDASPPVLSARCAKPFQISERWRHQFVRGLRHNWKALAENVFLWSRASLGADSLILPHFDETRDMSVRQKGRAGERSRARCLHCRTQTDSDTFDRSSRWHLKIAVLTFVGPRRLRSKCEVRENEDETLSRRPTKAQREVEAEKAPMGSVT